MVDTLIHVMGLDVGDLGGHSLALKRGQRRIKLLEIIVTLFRVVTDYSTC